MITTLFLQYPFEVRILIYLAALTLAISTIRSVGIFYFDGMEKMQYSASLNALNSLLLIAGGYIGWVVMYNLQGIFIGMLIGTLISTNITWIMVVKNHITPKISMNLTLIRHLLFEGLPLGLAAFAFTVYTRIDAVILNQLLGEYAVGIYSSATPFTFTLIQLLNVPFLVAVYPALARLSTEDTKRFSKAIKKSFVVILLWSIPATLLVALFAFMIPVMFGVKYTPAIDILRVLIFTVPFMSLSALLYKILIIHRKQKLYLIISIVGACINIGLNLLLIPLFNVMGEAFSAVITQGVLFAIYLIVVLQQANKKK